MASGPIRRYSSMSDCSLSISPANVFFVIASKTMIASLLLALQTVIIVLAAVLFLASNTSGVAERTEELALLLLLAGISAQTLGLFVSSIVTTETQAMQLTSLLFLLMFILSGFLQPLDELGAIGTYAGVSPLALGYAGTKATIEGSGGLGYALSMAGVAATLVILSTLVAGRTK